MNQNSILQNTIGAKIEDNIFHKAVRGGSLPCVQGSLVSVFLDTSGRRQYLVPSCRF